MVVLDAARCFFLLYTEKACLEIQNLNAPLGCRCLDRSIISDISALLVRGHSWVSRAAAETSPKTPSRDATLPYCDGREQHHGGHVVQEGGENGRDETEDDDHGPHSAPGQLIGLR